MSLADARPFARERLAGYSPEILDAPLIVCGAGAGGSAFCCLLAMWGFNRVTLVDPSAYDPSNATRVLDFPYRRTRSGRRVFKALERTARWRARLRAAGQPADGVKGIVGYAQELPPTIWRAAIGVVSCVDHPRARFDIATLTRRYNKPLLSAGFDATQSGATVEYIPASRAAACVRCALAREPEYAVSDTSCAAAAARAAEDRKLAATPNLAATSAALLAQALVDGLSHGWPEHACVHRIALPPRSRIRGGSFALDRDPACPHHAEPQRAFASLSGRTLGDVLGALELAFPGARLQLLGRIPLHALADDGTTLVRVALPPWRCPLELSIAAFPRAASEAHVLALDSVNLELARRFDLGRMPARWLGLGPGAIATAIDTSGGAIEVHDG